MNKCIFPLTLVVLISCGISAMEEHGTDGNKKWPFQEYKYTGVPSIHCPLIDEDEIGILGNEKSAKEMNEHMDFIVKQITKSETTQLFADVVKVYRESRYPERPWCGSGSTKRNIELLIESLKQEKTDDKDMCENLQYYNAEHQLLYIISEYKKHIRELMAARVALSLIELDELDKKASVLQKKLDEENAKKPDNSIES